ncbi:MAG: DNA repair protein RecN [Bacteroidetes bacterium HGW-Bacteroidetes-11]|jgi:DNA repair protein RecN (Recombination protein N)|nr:MAG: DNA repair protein RecN [Bacteroidetes bacterium HGW-Bacteroidetes-11]
MLIRLSIKNYALIRELDIEFGKSFSVITGETGAGKSIILGALSLILGQRIDNQSFSDNTAKCSIEGAFDISKCSLESYFDENDLDFDPVCIIRREITPQGKSRAFVNDTPVNLNQLKEITGKLVDVHSQHQTLLLQESAFQLSVVDSVAGCGPLLMQYKLAFKELNDLISKRAELLTKQKQSQSELDYLNFLFDELDKVRLVPGEQILAESEVEILSHAEEIKAKLYSAADLLLNRDENLLKQLNEVWNQLGAIAKYHTEIGDLSSRLKEVVFELKDIAETVDRLAENTSFDPARLEQLNERLSILYQFEQKHHVRSVEELIEIRDSIELKINGVTSLSESIEKLTREINSKAEKLNELSAKLTALRKKSLPLIESEVLKIVTQLGMKDARFSISISQLPTPGRNGNDAITFLFSANKGTPLNDLSKVASGGELSRLMLAVKSMISSSSLLPTIIFDEIDSGISGDVASKVGNILKKISEKMQVIVITHLPQIAGRSNEHFKVYKFIENEKTYSSIDRLNDDERIAELALMISGNPNLEAARETAKELLRNN